MRSRVDILYLNLTLNLILVLYLHRHINPFQNPQAIMDAQQIAKQARKSISKYCIEECKAYCCRKGYLILTEKECELVALGRKADLITKNLLKHLPASKYSLNIGSKDAPCPCLKDFMCTIHKRKYRPTVCKDFPLFLENNEIRLSTRCPAVTAGLFYPYVHRLIKLGYTIHKEHVASTYDVQNMFNFPPPKALAHQ